MLLSSSRRQERVKGTPPAPSIPPAARAIHPAAASPSDARAHAGCRAPSGASLASPSPGISPLSFSIFLRFSVLVCLPDYLYGCTGAHKQTQAHKVTHACAHTQSHTHTYKRTHRHTHRHIHQFYSHFQYCILMYFTFHLFLLRFYHPFIPLLTFLFPSSSPSLLPS